MNDKKERVIQAVVLKMVAVFSIDEHSVWMNLVSTVLLQKFFGAGADYSNICTTLIKVKLYISPCVSHSLI